MTLARVVQTTVEALTSGTGKARVAQTVIEVLATADAAAQVVQLTVEVLSSVSSGGSDQGVTSTLSLSNTATVTVSYPGDASNTLTLTGSANIQNQENVSSLLTFAQDVSPGAVHNRSASNALALSQSIATANIFNFSITDSLTLTDAARRTIDGIASSTLSLTEDASPYKFVTVTASNTLVLTETVDPSATFNRAVNQGLDLTQLASKTMYWSRDISQSLTLVESVVETLQKTASNSLALSQTATSQVGKWIKQTLELTSVTQGTVYYNRSLYSLLIPFQTITVEKTYRRTVSQSLTLVGTAVGQLVKSASNTLTLTQVATGTSAKPGSSVLTLTQLAVANFTRNLTVTSPVPLVQVINVQKAKACLATSPLGFNQFAHGTVVHNTSADNTLVLSQDLVQQRYLEAISQTITLAQSVVCQKITSPSIAQSLTLTQDLVLSKDSNLNITHQLVFLNSHIKNTGIEGMETSVDNVIVVKVQKVVVLKHGSDVIVLNAPEFNDSEAGTGSINIKRAMSGERYIYKKGSATSKLSYSFVLDRKKAIELRTFILNNNSNVIDMENWKGELWKVLLVNNPFQFVEAAYWNSPWGNKCTVTLDFEGGKLN